MCTVSATTAPIKS